jgi:hypothetical protein
LVRDWISSALSAQSDAQSAIQISAIQIPVPEVKRTGHQQALTPSDLTTLLGQPLPKNPQITWGLEGTSRPQQVQLTTQPGFSVPATVLRPGPDGGGVASGHLLVLLDAGRESATDDEIVQSALRRNWFVWAVDVRGLGSLKSEREGFILGASVLLGENFAWRQTSDAIRILANLRDSSYGHRTGLYARGTNASIIAAYVAATAERDQPEWIVFRDGVDTFYGAGIPQYLIPMNAFDRFDWRDLLKLAKPKIIRLTRPEDFSEDDW